MWFSWSPERGAFFVSAFAGASKLSGLHTGTSVALSIDSDDFPYRSLNVRGAITAVDPAEGLTDDYVRAAERYLGQQNARRWIAHLGPACKQVGIEIRPLRVIVADVARDSDFMSPPD
jgi:hypothetical protein